MATISIPKNYADGTPLFESDLDDIRTGVQDFLNTTKLNDDNIQNSGITASTKLKDGSVTGAKLDSSVADDSTLELSGTTLSIKDNGVSKAKQEDMSVTTDGTDPGAGNIVFSSEYTSGTIASTSYVTLTEFDITLTTTGRPVFIGFQSTNDSAATLFTLLGENDNEAFIKTTRDGSTIVSETRMRIAAEPAASNNIFSAIPHGAFNFIDYGVAGSPGTYNYTVEIKVFDANSRFNMGTSRMYAYEL